MTTFLIAHGAWSAGWAWKKMRPLLRGAGHEVFTPTYTGARRTGASGEPGGRPRHAHPGRPRRARMEDLGTSCSIGHSYGGMVATGVADRVRERIAQLIYLDAFVPRDGQSLLDLRRPETPRPHARLARAGGEGWRVPPNPLPPDTARGRPGLDHAAPAAAAAQDLRAADPPAAGDAEPPPRSYIYCQAHGPDDVFRQFAKRAQARSGWRYFEIDASHNPHITAPQALMALLERIVAT